jgi:hypothetical protein
LETTIENKKIGGDEQVSINEKEEKLAAISDIQKQENTEFGDEEDDANGDEKEESMDDIFGDLDMPTEQLVRLAQLRKMVKIVKRLF